MYALPELIIAIILSAAIYGAFPLIYARLRCKRVTARSYRIVCYCVNFAVTFIIAMFSSTSDIGNNNSAGVVWSYIFWTGIFTRPGVKILRSRGVLEGEIAGPQENEAPAENDAERAEAAQGARQTLRFCTRCGFELAENSRFCSRCGASVDDM